MGSYETLGTHFLEHDPFKDLLIDIQGIYLSLGI